MDNLNVLTKNSNLIFEFTPITCKTIGLNGYPPPNSRTIIVCILPLVILPFSLNMDVILVFLLPLLPSLPSIILLQHLLQTLFYLLVILLKRLYQKLQTP